MAKAGRKAELESCSAIQFLLRPLIGAQVAFHHCPIPRQAARQFGSFLWMDTSKKVSLIPIGSIRNRLTTISFLVTARHA
ncbi:MAG: hypothetical protein HQL95_10260 [Magnetococcales bacterium]|nr:hypothetical protein [Magnetococcales bacterium]